jgi:hypothetical protein
VDEIVVFSRKNTPLIGVKSWKKAKPVVEDRRVRVSGTALGVPLNNWEIPT